MHVGEWEIRKHVVTRSLKKLVRYGHKLAEEATLMVRKMQESGQNVTQGTLIFDLGSFNLVQNGCPNCKEKPCKIKFHTQVLDVSISFKPCRRRLVAKPPLNNWGPISRIHP